MSSRESSGGQPRAAGAALAELCSYYGIADFDRQIANYHLTFADQIREKLPSEPIIEDWRINGIYFGHHRTGLGEILSYTALPRFFKKHFPEWKVYFCGHRFGEALFRRNPYVDGVVDFPNRESYGSGKEFGFGTTTQRRLLSFGIFAAETLGPEVFVGEEASNRWLEWREKLPLNGRKLVLVQSSGRTNPKVYSFWRWFRMLRAMRDEFFFVQVGNLRDQFIWANQIHLKQWDMEDLAAILKIADAFVGPNSGVMHLASAVNTPTVVLHNEAHASEMRLPILTDNWLLPGRANHHLFHVYPWHYHAVIDKLWDIDRGSTQAFAARDGILEIRELIRQAAKGENPIWSRLKMQLPAQSSISLI